MSLATGEEEFRDEVERTERVIGPLPPPTLFRPPGGLIRPAQVRTLRSLGDTCVLGASATPSS